MFSLIHIFIDLKYLSLQAELEMRRKMELIHQIKAMEAVPIIRQKLVDLSESAGHGLLSEMSIAEVSQFLLVVIIHMLCKGAS